MLNPSSTDVVFGVPTEEIKQPNLSDLHVLSIIIMPQGTVVEPRTKYIILDY